jgi:hypothetical protein
LKCSKFPACQYWSYGSSGSNAKYARPPHDSSARLRRSVFCRSDL